MAKVRIPELNSDYPDYSIINVCDYCGKLGQVCCGDMYEGHCPQCHQKDKTENAAYVKACNDDYIYAFGLN